MKNKNPKIPILYYEEPNPGEPANPIPYIEVEINDEMPKVLFISEYKETGEFEVDTGMGSQPIWDMLIHKYVDLDHLQKLLKPKLFDKIRTALGMKPLKEAQKAGKPLLDQVFKNADLRKTLLETSKPDREARAFTLGEGLRQKSEKFLEQEDKEKENKDTN